MPKSFQDLIDEIAEREPLAKKGDHRPSLRFDHRAQARQGRLLQGRVQTLGASRFAQGENHGIDDSEKWRRKFRAV